MTREIGFHRTACSDAFHGFPEGWNRDYCARVEGVVCSPESARIVRLSLSAGAHPHVSASLLVDGKIVASTSTRPGAEGAEDHTALGSHSELTQNTVLVLPKGCHVFSVVYEDSQPEDRQNNCGRVRFFITPVIEALLHGSGWQLHRSPHACHLRCTCMLK
jgi:hypothetical protein